ncbi:MAG TPA: glycosyltransferase [Terracidiphilus sp.]|nr:glycosyltransferase [Terracidiphilus sp.]
MITAITVTYGRVKFLERALAAFLAQRVTTGYDDAELLILNTYPRQKLVYDNPFVRVVNLDHRPWSLGNARNIAVEQSKGDRIIIWDDDDMALPHLIDTFSENWREFDEWLWLDKRLCANGDTITEISQGCNGGCFGFTKKAWKEVGGYPNMTVGEDRVLVGKITKLPGRLVHLGDTMPPFIYCWGNGAYHISGQGDDKSDTPSAHVRAEAALNRRIETGEEKTGTIVLKPHCDTDWPRLANEFMGQRLKKNSVSDVCVVELGRYGDIVNILPILLHIHNEFGTPTLMVSREFADLLDGVSYVIPRIVDLRNDQLAEALKIARKEYKHVLCAQIWGGPNYPQERLCPSYNMESWRMCGFLHKFTDWTWRPVFDRRDKEREAALVAKLTVPGRPMLLLNVTHSVSSPFPQGALLLTAIQEALGAEFNIVNLGGLKLHRIYDLLGLMDAAACLVSVDSAHLHLAAATNVPVFALVNDTPWLATVTRGHYAGGFTYNRVMKDSSDLITDLLIRASDATSSSPTVYRAHRHESPMSPPARRIFHCVERHQDKSRSEQNRKGIAQKSWEKLYEQGVVPCPLDEKDYPRTAMSIGEQRNLPYLKDVLANGLNMAGPDDIILFTNDDNVLHPQLPEMLQYHVSLYECCCGQRCEFRGAPMPPMRQPPNDFAQAGQSHMGRDMLAFTKRWLQAHWDELPDFILGASDWDLSLAAIIRNHFGIKTTRQNLEDVLFPAEIPLGYVSHSFHQPRWNAPGYVNSAPSQIWNRTLFKKWSETHAPHLKFDVNLCI